MSCKVNLGKFTLGLLIYIYFCSDNTLKVISHYCFPDVFSSPKTFKPFPLNLFFGGDFKIPLSLAYFTILHFASQTHRDVVKLYIPKRTENKPTQMFWHPLQSSCAVSLNTSAYRFSSRGMFVCRPPDTGRPVLSVSQSYSTPINRDSVSEEVFTRLSQAFRGLVYSSSWVCLASFHLTFL